MRETFTEDERHVLFAATLAQCENIHALAWSLSEQQHGVAERLLAEFSRVKPTTPLSTALVGALSVVVHDADHPVLDDQQWFALEFFHVPLATEFGHLPRTEPAR